MVNCSISKWWYGLELGRCFLCQQSCRLLHGLCHYCMTTLPDNDSSCMSCGSLLAQPSPRCGHCTRAEYDFDQMLAAYRYAYPVDRAIYGIKYQGQVAGLRSLSSRLCASLEKRYENRSWPSQVYPVPLHPRRERERGFNQSMLLAEFLLKALKKVQKSQQLHIVQCTRKEYLGPQQGLSRTARRKNVKGAFELSDGRVAPHLAIVDDVVTSGSTVNELATLLKQAGAEQVDVWCIARA